MGVSLTVSNRPDNLALIQRLVSEQSREWELSARAQAHLELVAEELFTNVVNYGYNPGDSGQIAVFLDRQGPRIRLILEDDARPFDPTREYPSSNDLDLENRPIGGLGLCLIRRLAESIVYYRTADNKNRIVVYLPA